MKKHYETHVEDTDKLISVAGPILEYKSWYEQYRKLMEEQAQRKYGLYTPTSEGDDDDFPSISGMIARYSASGLTNEEMSKNPVWVDKTGNGHDLQMKNFAWSEMSGVGGYKLNWGDSNIWSNYITRGTFGTGEVTDNTIHITSAKTNNSLFETRASLKSVEYKVLIKGLTDDIYLRYGVFNDGKELWTEIKNDGIYTLPSYDYDSRYNMKWKVVSQTYPIDCNITIEQLPLYPGALVFDGVDDWAGCDNLPLLPKEKGYSIIALRNWITRYDATQYKRPLISNLDTNDEGAFLIEYRKDENVNDVTGSYNSFTDVYIDDNNPITWQTSSSYNGQIIKKGTSKSTNKLCICKTYFGQLSNYANAAIWELVILDHDATEEELTKIKDYFIKTYPWLFPYQAWTVTGKTNEDEDRATIANITGNGNDLVLSNLGFIEGSGYNEEGEYAGYLVTDGVDDKITSSTFEMGNDWTVIGDWELINTGKNDNAGIVKFDSIVIYNYNPILINIKNGRNNLIPDQNTVNAICSDGRIYSKDWKESIYNEETESTSKNLLTIGYSGNSYTKIAFKNLAIYPTVLSKEDCIKAYNYLQTLKAK